MSDYKKRALEAVEAAEQKSRKDLETAFDKRKPLHKRLAAFQNVGSIADEVVLRQALELVEDAKMDPQLRAAALAKIANQLGKDEGRLDRLTQMTVDKTLPDPLREAALKGLQANSFSSPTFLARRPAYLGALRALVDDDNKKLRETAIEYLAMNKDEYVQRRLLDGLESPKKKITKPELAVQYLAYDLHADHFPILRKLVQDPPNKKTRIEALRNLAADSESKDLLATTMADGAEDSEVRHLCAVGLQRLDPVGFDKSSARILRAAAEDAELKVALLNTKLHTPGAEVPQIAADLEKVMKGAKGKALKGGKRLSRLIQERTKS